MMQFTLIIALMYPLNVSGRHFHKILKLLSFLIIHSTGTHLVATRQVSADAQADTSSFLFIGGTIK